MLTAAANDHQKLWSNLMDPLMRTSPCKPVFTGAQHMLCWLTPCKTTCGSKGTEPLWSVITVLTTPTGSAGHHSHNVKKYDSPKAGGSFQKSRKIFDDLSGWFIHLLQWYWFSLILTFKTFFWLISLYHKQRLCGQSQIIYWKCNNLFQSVTNKHKKLSSGGKKICYSRSRKSYLGFWNFWGSDIIYCLSKHCQTFIPCLFFITEVWLNLNLN